MLCPPTLQLHRGGCEALSRARSEALNRAGLTRTSQWQAVQEPKEFEAEKQTLIPQILGFAAEPESPVASPPPERQLSGGAPQLQRRLSGGAAGATEGATGSADSPQNLSRRIGRMSASCAPHRQHCSRRYTACDSYDMQFP